MHKIERRQLSSGRIVGRPPLSRRNSSIYTTKMEDLISELPDELLHHILSMLDMTYVMQTSILSKRWRYLWRSLPYLKFRGLVYDDALYSFLSINSRLEEFQDFVDNVLLLHRNGSDIIKLDLSSDGFRIETGQIKNWVNAAVSLNVQEFDIQIKCEDRYLNFPEYCLFNCQSLTTLKLGLGKYKSTAGLDIPDSVDLPHLKTLHFTSIVFSNGERLSNLLSRCPVLETLLISNCVLEEPDSFTISASPLRDLVIENFHLQSEFFKRRHFKIIACAPNLTSFRCKEHLLKEYSLLNISSLVDVDIDIELTSFYDRKIISDASQKQDIRNVIMCLQCLTNVSSLTIGVWLLEGVFKDPAASGLGSSLTPFFNLSLLKLKVPLWRNEILNILCLLDMCPNVETLELEILNSPFCQKKNKVRGNSGEKAQSWNTELPLQCMKHHLKYVKIRDAMESSDELDFLKFLLMNAMLLEKVFTFTSKDGNNDRRLNYFREELVIYPRASSNIIISFF